MIEPTKNLANPLEKPKKRPYHHPTLHPYGDIRDVTLGASPGVTDSGSLGKAVGT